MDKSLWAKRIADRIHTGEKDLDQCITSMMEVVAEVQKAQADLNVSAVSTDSSLSKFMEALALLQQARSSTVAGHRRIEKLGEALNIRTTGFGINPGKTMVQDDEQAPAAVEHQTAVNG